MAGLSSVLANIPGLAGWEAARQSREESQGNQLRQASGVMGLQQALQAQAMKQQEAAREQQFRAAIAQARTPEEQLAVASKFMGPDALGKMIQGGQDRAAQRDVATTNANAMREQRLAELQERGAQQIERIREQAAQQRITREEADARERQTREYMARLMAQLKPPAPQRQVQLTTDAAGNQLVVNPDGTTKPLTTQDGAGVTKPVGADKPMTEFQGKAALYGTRAAQSDQTLSSLEDKISTEGLYTKQALARAPVVGGLLGYAGNLALSTEQQRVEQAQRDFVNAILRQESGAVISDAEFENARKQYFPAPGDSKETVEQKRRNRKLAVDGFKRMSGPKGAVDIDAIIKGPSLSNKPQAATGNVPPPPPGFEIDR